MKLVFRLAKETKGCYRFKTEPGDDWTALYLKKRAVEAAGINPYAGITVTISEGGMMAEPGEAGQRLFGRG